jgi:2-oxoglutarate ferredoxin oxidoreductase subunit alpha
VAHAHFRYLSPLPANTEAVLRAYPKVLAPELNLGQFAAVLRANYVIDVVSMPKIQGQPFRVSELTERILDMTESA